MDDDFEQYARARTGALLRLAYLLTGDAHLAEDVVQEVLVRTHSKWGHITTVSSPHAYVRRMVVNEVHSRHRRRRVLELLRSPDQLPEHPVADPSGLASDRDLMWRLVSSLPPRQRAVLVLRYYEDLPDAEIAETLSVAVGTVRSTAFRALANLRSHADLAHQDTPSVTVYTQESR